MTTSQTLKLCLIDDKEGKVLNHRHLVVEVVASWGLL